jgi:hypothetical protein
MPHPHGVPDADVLDAFEQARQHVLRPSRSAPWLLVVDRRAERIVLVARSMKWVEQCSTGRSPHTASDISNAYAAPKWPGDLDVGTHWIAAIRRAPGALLGDDLFGLLVMSKWPKRDIQLVRCCSWVS